MKKISLIILITLFLDSCFLLREKVNGDSIGLSINQDTLSILDLSSAFVICKVQKNIKQDTLILKVFRGYGEIIGKISIEKNINFIRVDNSIWERKKYWYDPSKSYLKKL